MAGTKSFQTNTVEATKSVVDDKLKPTAEMHILLGGPYSAPDGEEHRYGHTALRLKTINWDLTYDFGRYGKTTGMFGESGDGILRTWTSFGSYIKGENSLKRKATGFVYLLFDHQVAAARAYFEQLTKGGAETIKTLEENAMKRGDLWLSPLVLNAERRLTPNDIVSGAHIRIANKKINTHVDGQTFEEDLVHQLKRGKWKRHFSASCPAVMGPSSFLDASDKLTSSGCAVDPEYSFKYDEWMKV